MLPDKNELAKRYANLPNDQLLDILYHQDDYTAEAIEAVKAEINTRKIGVDELETFTVEKKVSKIINEENARAPLSLRAKLFFFFAWFVPVAPLAFGMNYREDGFTTKLWQSRFFRITGVVSLIVSALLSVWLELGDPGAFGLLAVLFGVSYSLDPKKKMTVESET
ncbi:hypothetical protein [Chryseolinea soli]|uniref:Uncharacterized protein n=1 Tax=Chryseolinea soli TaxID=2321403 RepID=A0A385SWU5_9BACT|nr:hypothetical protein [Chryseolinea soli]AYB34465.1 hypothetical protein D4L85_29525 [Chryseolinea soli]